MNLKLNGKNRLVLLSLFVLLISNCNVSAGAADISPARTHGGSVAVYPPLPNNQYRSDRYEVSVYQTGSGHSSYVYADTNNDLRYPFDRFLMTLDNHFTTFSFGGEVLVQIKMPLRPAGISSVVVHPLSKHLKASVSGNTISIPLAKPDNIYVEVDGEARHPLFIFANPPEADEPSPNDPNVLYFGPGIHDVGIKDGPAQKIAVGKTVYLAGGAYVKGVLETAGTPGTTTIRGRGILSGVNIPGYSAYNSFIGARRGSLKVEGIILLDAPQGYQGIVAGGKGSVVDNVKMLSWAMESDSGYLGENSRITNCFFKINDDVLKPIKPGMLFQDNTVWQQMCGKVIMLGWNSTEQGINATVSGLDVIGCDRGVRGMLDKTSQAVIGLENDNGATYKGMTIENVRFDKRPYMLFGVHIKIEDSGFASDPKFNKGLGSIDGMVFRNIRTSAAPVRISSFNGNGNVTAASTGDIKNVLFENLYIAGELVTETNAQKYIVQKGKTSGFRYLSTGKSAASE